MNKAFVNRTEAKDKLAVSILEALRDYGDIIASKDLYDLVPQDLYTFQSFKNFLQYYVKAYYPDKVRAVPKKGYMYIYKNKEIKEEPKSTGFKNSEGYSDPTAGKALANVMMEPKTQETNYFPGEVWTRSTGAYMGPKKKELVLVIAASKGNVNYIPVYDSIEEKGFYYSGYCKEFESTSGKKYFVDWRQIRTSGCNPFKDGSYEFAVDDDIFNYILDQIGKRFGLGETIVKEVPKIVYETKEVPATITEEDAIEFLAKSGWLANHDRVIGSKAAVEAQQLYSKELAVALESARIWETCFRLTVSGSENL